MIHYNKMLISDKGIIVNKYTLKEYIKYQRYLVYYDSRANPSTDEDLLKMIEDNDKNKSNFKSLYYNFIFQGLTKPNSKTQKPLLRNPYIIHNKLEKEYLKLLKNSEYILIDSLGKAEPISKELVLESAINLFDPLKEPVVYVNENLVLENDFEFSYSFREFLIEEMESSKFSAIYDFKNKVVIADSIMKIEKSWKVWIELRDDSDIGIYKDFIEKHKNIISVLNIKISSNIIKDIFCDFANFYPTINVKINLLKG